MSYPPTVSPLGKEIIVAYLDDFDDDAAQVRSQVKGAENRDIHRDYSAGFYLVYELHGRLSKDSTCDDDASLLVFRIQPKTNNDLHKFQSFKATLKCERVNPADDRAYFAAAAPAMDGEQVLERFDVNVSNTRSLSANLNLNGGPAPVSGGFSGSSTGKEDFTLRQAHTISADVGQSSLRVPRKKPDCAWWELKAAPKAGQGIGDYFTVAVVVHRGDGKQVRITASTEARIGGSMASKLRNSFGTKKDDIILGIYGTRTASQTVLPQIDVNSLLNSTDFPEVERKILHVGVHVPEDTAALVVLGRALVLSTDA